MRIPRIAVCPSRDFHKYERTLVALGELYGLEFVPGAALNAGQYDAAILFDATSSDVLVAAEVGSRALAYLQGSRRPFGSPSGDVCFPDLLGISPALRGATVPDASAGETCDLVPEPGDEVVARKGDDILWLRRQVNGTFIDLIATPAPVLNPEEYLFDICTEANWLSTVPLLHFAQEVSGWTMPPVRACFMFDDPNLHWTSYGYVRYQEVADAADADNFHVSFATVPLDAWYVHQRTARLFRERRRRISLLVHGNDHTHFELHGATDPLATATHALARIERLERRAGVTVSRVMAAPHGACSEQMANALLRTGFEAACISRGSLMVRNPNVDWPVSVGLRPAEFFGQGLPVIPRVGMQPLAEVRVRLAAFLGQPIIPVGHHDDLRDGVDLLRRLARMINAIGPVEWADLETIARSNYLSRVSGHTLDLRLYSRDIRVTMPDGITDVRIDTPWSAAAVEGLVASDTGVTKFQVHAGSVKIPIQARARLRVQVPAERIEGQKVHVHRTSFRALARRQLCEVRDRVRPTVEGLLRTRQN